jgi:7-carboxy-7-deazaguanine synthase
MIRVSEIYTSVQGEGPLTGTITQFMRTAGCNMRCPGWPCDTEHAINPHLFLSDGTTVKRTADSIFEQLITEANDRGAGNICLTGGEPLLQPTDDLDELRRALRDHECTVEMFTNGSFLIPTWWIDPNDGAHLEHVMMDWKLEGSGEANTNVAQRTMNAQALRETDGIKFVVKDGRDVEEALRVARRLRTDGVVAVFWLGAAWDRVNTRWLCDVMINSIGFRDTGPWKLNVQVHKYIWPADERGV